MSQKAIIIGGGAAGFFCAIQLKSKNPHLEVVILEKQAQVLSKVKVSGGGRCNLTNNEKNLQHFATNYPRGAHQMNLYLKKFSNKDFLNWLSQKGIQTKAEKDQRIFPASDQSQTVIDCFLKECKKLNIVIQTKKSLHSFQNIGEQFQLNINENETQICDYLIIATGGANDIKFYKHLTHSGISITDIIPSLFTLNNPTSNLIPLMGVSSLGSIRLNNHSNTQQGPILITHWGISGPAVLKLSAFEAEELYRNNYQMQARLNWTHFDIHSIETQLTEYRNTNPKKNVRSVALFEIPSRLWEYFCNECTVGTYEKWAEFGNKKLKQMTQLISNYPFEIKGKTTFKEEFVACGGVQWTELNENTLELNRFKNMYCCGEVLNIDGITGGFNFQAAWSTAYVVAESISQKLNH